LDRCFYQRAANVGFLGTKHCIFWWVLLNRLGFGRDVCSLDGENTNKWGNRLPVHSKKTIITDALNPRPKILPVVRMTKRIITLVGWMCMKKIPILPVGVVTVKTPTSASARKHVDTLFFLSGLKHFY
jgi:hypothetical protein